MKRIVYLGNLIEVLEKLCGRKDLLIAGWVVEKEDDQKGRLAELAKAINVPCYAVGSRRELTSALKSCEPLDLGLIANFGLILNARQIRIPKKGFVNAHLGILPDYPGRRPIEKVLKNGGVTTGVTLHRVTAQVDAGPILAQKMIAIGAKRTNHDVLARLARIAPALIDEKLSSLLHE